MLLESLIWKIGKGSKKTFSPNFLIQQTAVSRFLNLFGHLFFSLEVAITRDHTCLVSCYSSGLRIGPIIQLTLLHETFQPFRCVPLYHQTEYSLFLPPQQVIMSRISCVLVLVVFAFLLCSANGADRKCKTILKSKKKECRKITTRCRKGKVNIINRFLVHLHRPILNDLLV